LIPLNAKYTPPKHKQLFSYKNGSFVKTNQGYLFLSIALGKIKMNEATVIVLSPQSPLGTKLIGSKIADTVEMNGISYYIEDIQ
jgi:hypothetical protein